jgi:uncharacterized protein YbbC (DUF1343 family)
MHRTLTTIFFFSLAMWVQAQLPVFKTQEDYVMGAERFRTLSFFDSLITSPGGVGVVCNHTSMVQYQNTAWHLVDYLEDLYVPVTRVFAPEHGFRGTANAGEKVEDGVDQKTGLKVVSLYGSHKKPTPEDLKGITLMVFDIQDVGARFYTYISTMFYVMEACAEQGIPVVVLDRPNPNGFYVDGPMLDPAFSSFVGLLPLPVVHGLTVGELAEMINGEGWLANGIKCELSVVKCEGYTHDDIYVLPIKPSPNLPNANSVLLYPSLCFFEGTDFSVGRGTDHPFEVFGHPNMGVGSYLFVPEPNDGASSPNHQGVPCIGWDLTEIGGKRIQEKQTLILDWLVNAYRDFPQKEKFFLSNGFFDKLAGTDLLRKQIEAGMSADEIRATWKADLDAYLLMRSQYLLYP